MDKLRLECPWDKEQTFETLRNLTIEETYELADAILEKNWDGVKNELGDLLLHIVFYAILGNEKKLFDIYDIADHICEKLVNRHPHVFGNMDVETSDDVAKNWESIKLLENKSVVEGVPQKLPALIKAFRIQEKVSGVGFDWKEKEDVLGKILEELSELRAEISKKDKNAIELEFGDFLFSVVNYARSLNVDPETALEKSNKKFIERFKKMELEAERRGLNISKMKIEEMNLLWEKAKK
jgi:XTP/dITP diphosphohydrolase